MKAKANFGADIDFFKINPATGYDFILVCGFAIEFRLMSGQLIHSVLGKVCSGGLGIDPTKFGKFLPQPFG